MATFAIEIPEEIVNTIKHESNIEPGTYLQEKIVEPIISEYKKSLVAKNKREEKQKLEDQVAEAKKQIKFRKG